VQYRAPRGTRDILPAEQSYWRHVEATARELAHLFGYAQIDTPIFEQRALFDRSVGQGTDIVEKETYTFQDRGGEELTLRPEGTAPICRAYLEHGMSSLPQPVRLYYFCPNFRYERPQAGRYRHFNQCGVEAIGDSNPAVDAEVIELSWRLVEELGLSGQQLLVNSIGDGECRPRYLERLRSHYTHHLGKVCTDCHHRFERNVLRMLDCKRSDFGCQELIAEAPRSADHLCTACAGHWSKLLYYLDALDLPYTVEPRLVRGLDYYTRTAFEIQPPGKGAQSTVLGGGRYDGLIQELGGQPTPGIGFGAGMERLVLNVKRRGEAAPENDQTQVVVIGLGEVAYREAHRLASHLRREGIQAVLAPAGRSMRGQMRHATALKARYSLILGEEEVQKETVTVKNMARSEQMEIPAKSAASVVRAG
jgi:histidyl-tRNA synthetase